MSQPSTTSGIPFKYFLGSIGLFAVFGFLALILSGFAGHETLEERSYQGEFSTEVKEARWANLEEVSAAQAALVDSKKIDSALASIAKSPAKAAKTATVVPGSPTFMKQMEAEAAKAAAAEEAAKKEAAPAPKADEAAPAPAPKQEEAKPAVSPKAEEAKPAPEKKAAPAAEAPKQ
jgi:ferredoxin-NADP reductase